MHESSLTDAMILESDSISAVFSTDIPIVNIEDAVDVFRRDDANLDRAPGQPHYRPKRYTVQVDTPEQLAALRARIERVRGTNVGMVSRDFRKHALAQLNRDALVHLCKKRMGVHAGTVLPSGTLLYESILDVEYGKA